MSTTTHNNLDEWVWIDRSRDSIHFEFERPPSRVWRILRLLKGFILWPFKYAWKAVTSPRFSLRAVLIVTSILGVIFGLLGRPVTQSLVERAVIDQAEQHDGVVTLTRVRPKTWAESLIQTFGPNRLSRRVQFIEFRNPTLPKPLPVALLEDLGQLEQLTALSFNGFDFDEKSIAALAKIETLSELSIHHSASLDNAAILKLKDHSRLRNLNLAGTSVTSSGFRELMTSLEIPADTVPQRVAKHLATELNLRGGWASWRAKDGESSLRLSSPGMPSQLATLSEFLVDADMPLELDVTAAHLSAPDIASKLEQLDDVVAVNLRFHKPADKEIFARVARLRNLRHLTIYGPVTGGRWEDLLGLKHLETLMVKEPTDLFDNDIAALSQLSSLKTLRVPRAAITTRHLDHLLATSKQRLQFLQLPETFWPYRDEIRASTNAKVKLTSAKNPWSKLPTTNDRRDPTGILFTQFIQARAGRKLPQHAWQQEMIANLDHAMSDAVFPAPAGSPMRPEDMMLVLRRYTALRLAHKQLRLSSRDPRAARVAVRVLEQALQRSWRADLPISEVLALNESDVAFAADVETEALRTERIVVKQLSQLWEVLAVARLRTGDFGGALDAKARQLILCREHVSQHDVLSRPEWLAKLCRIAPSTSVTHDLKQVFFLIPDGDEATWQDPATTVVGWNEAPLNWVGILAPEGKVLSTVRTDAPQLTVWLGDTSETALENEMTLPESTHFLFVPVDQFPISVTLKDEVDVDTGKTLNEFD